MFKPELFVGTVLFVWRASNHTIRTDTDSLLAAGLISIVGIAKVEYICSYIYTKYFEFSIILRLIFVDNA